MTNPLIMKKYIILSFSLFIFSFCKAQLPPGEYTTKNKKAISFFEEALKAYDARKEIPLVEITNHGNLCCCWCPN